MNFSEALELLKQGKKLTCKSWYNPNTKIWIELQYPDKDSKMTKPYIFMNKYDHKFPCPLSCEAIMAEDWMVME